MLAIPIRRAGRFVVLAAAVALMHLLLLSGGWEPQGWPVDEPPPVPTRMVLVVAPKSAPAAALPSEPPTAVVATDLPTPSGPTPPDRSAGAESSTAPTAGGTPAPSPAVAPLPPPEPEVPPPTPAAGVETPKGGSSPVETASAPQAVVLAAAAPPPPSAASEVPPDGRILDLPPAAAVPAATWTYLASRGQAAGEALIQWSPSEADYELSLTAQVAGKPLLDWISRGRVTSLGLMPARMVERQRERETHAVNFQRDKDLISFSGPARTDPLLPGAQDRLSWIVQVMAVARARGELQPGEVLRFQVAGPRGDVDEWRFTVQPATQKLMHGRMLPLTHLVREPQRPYDLRVQIWLARQFDHLPVGLSWGVEPGGEPLILWIQGLPINL